MFVLYTLLVALTLLCSCSGATITTDFIGFPEVEQNLNLKNKENRQPVYLPAICSVNELYYPGDQKDDWICDCKPGFLYHPRSDNCWGAFRQGPCANGSYLILPHNSPIPVCEKNPCGIDNYVQWNGKCERFGSPDPCRFMYPVPATLGVNATTLVVSCVRISFDMRISEIAEPRGRCAPGCKSSVIGNCVLQ